MDPAGSHDRADLAQPGPSRLNGDGKERPQLKLQITVDGKTYDVEVELVEELEDETQPSKRASFPRPKPAPSSKFGQSYPAPLKADPKVCLSPVTGTVMKLSAETGQHVAAGDSMLVLESMEIETVVKAPMAATIKAVHVQQDEIVKLNQPLVEFE